MPERWLLVAAWQPPSFAGQDCYNWEMLRAAPPEGVIEVVGSVMAAVGHPGPWFIEREPTGRSNFVYRVADQAGRAFAVRIGRRAESRFPAEFAAMQAAERAGVPVPRVRHVGEVVHRGEVFPVMVTNWTEARPMRVAVNGGAGITSAGFVRSLAKALAATHSVEVSGFGNLGADLSSPWSRFDDWFLDGLEPKVERSRVAIRNDPVLGNGSAAESLLDTALAELLDARGSLPDEAPTLVHGDVSPDNVLINLTDGVADSVSVVLDWESAKGGPPALDFGWWDYIGGSTHVPTDTLIAAYQAETGTSVDHLDEVRRLVRIRILLGEFGWLVDADADVPPSLVPTARALATELHGSPTT